METIQPILQLHCGACGDLFDNTWKLQEHITTCPAAIVLLPIFYKSIGDNDLLGHPYAGWVMMLHKYQLLIKEYALAISNNIDNISRAKIHLKLCESLGIDYKTFKPFEAKWIKEIPTFEEAKKILWYALEDYIKMSIEKEYGATTK